VLLAMLATAGRAPAFIQKAQRAHLAHRQDVGVRRIDVLSILLLIFISKLIQNTFSCRRG
jgi:hypothetical protein